MGLSRIRDQLSEIPPLLDRLDLLPSQSQRTDDVPLPVGRSLMRAPLRLEVIDLRADLKPGWSRWRPGDDHDDSRKWRDGVPGMLRKWAGWLEVEMINAGLTPTSYETTARSICEWMILHLAWINDHHQDFSKWVDRWHAALQRANGIKREPVYHCTFCGWVIESKDDHAWWRCTGCAKTWTSLAEIDRLLADQEDSQTLAQIASAIGRPVNTLYDWHQLGWLMPVGKRGRARLFSLAAAQKLADTVKAGRPRKLSHR